MSPKNTSPLRFQNWPTSDSISAKRSPISSLTPSKTLTSRQKHRSSHNSAKLLALSKSGKILMMAQLWSFKSDCKIHHHTKLQATSGFIPKTILKLSKPSLSILSLPNNNLNHMSRSKRSAQTKNLN